MIRDIVTIKKSECWKCKHSKNGVLSNGTYVIHCEKWGCFLSDNEISWESNQSCYESRKRNKK